MNEWQSTKHKNDYEKERHKKVIYHFVKVKIRNRVCYTYVRSARAQVPKYKSNDDEMFALQFCFHTRLKLEDF